MKTYDEELAELVAAEKAGSRARHPAGKKLGGGPVGYATGGLVERGALPRIEHETGFVIPGPWLDRGWSTLGTSTDAVVEILAPPQNGRAPLSPAGFESAWLDVHWHDDAVALVHAGEWRIPAADVTAVRRTGWARLRFEIADAWDVLRVGLVQPVIEWATARVRRWTR